MNIMKKLLSVLLVLAMLLSFAACDSSSKKNNNDDDDEEESKSEVKLNNDFEGKYEGEIAFIDYYCFTLNYPTADAKEYAEDVKDYTVTTTIDIKADTLDISFECSDKDIKGFVNDFYTAFAKSMFDEDEVESRLEEAEEQIQKEIASLKDVIDETENDVQYEFDGDDQLSLTFGDGILRLEIDFGSKKFTVEDFDAANMDLEKFAGMFKGVTFKKIANYEGGNKDNSSDAPSDVPSNNTSKDESKPESKPQSKPESKPESSDTPSILPPQESSNSGIDVPSTNDEIDGTYVGEIDLLDVYYALNGRNSIVYNAEPYMDATYSLEVVIEINNGVMSLDITEDNAIIDAFVQSFAYAFLKASVPNYTEEQLAAAVAQMAGDIASDQASMKILICALYFSNKNYTFDDSSELKVDVDGEITIFNVIIDATTGNFEIFSVYDEAYNNDEDLEAVFDSTVFVKQ